MSLSDLGKLLGGATGEVGHAVRHAAPAPGHPVVLRSRPAPAPAPTSTPLGRVTAAPLSAPSPLAQAQTHAKVQVQRAIAARPKAPTPYIPRLPNPSRAQAQAALDIARRSQERAVGSSPAPGRVRQYQQELRADPRQREYIATVEHYARAMQGQLRAAGVRPSPVRALAAPPSRSNPGGLLATILPHLVAKAIPDLAAKRAEVSGLVDAVGSISGSAASILAGNEPKTGNLAVKGLGEVASFPAQTIESLAQTGGAALKAATGNPGPLEQIGEGMLQTVTHPVKSFEAHPLTTVLTLAGGEEAAGRLAGAAARTGVLGDAAANAASTARAPLGLYNDMAVERHFSSDPMRKAVQVAADKAMAHAPGEYRQVDPNQATGARLARHVKGATVKPGEVDVSVAAGEAMRRNLKGETVKAVRGVKPAHGADAVPLIVEGIVRSPGTVTADLTKERGRLLAAQTGGPEPLTGRELAANQENVARIDGLLKDGRFLVNPAPAFAAAARYAQATAPLTEALQRVGHLAPEQTRAALFPYAQAHMGARYFSVADHQAAEATARGVERDLRARSANVQAAITRAEGGVKRARTVEKIRLVIDRANRPGSEGERAAAIAKVEQLKAQQGITDLRSVPSPAAAESALAGAHADAVQLPEAMARAKAYRIAVSGRGDPDGVLAHEETLRRHAEARTLVPKAREDLRKAETARSRLVGRQQVQRAQNGRRVAAQQELAAADARVLGRKEALRAANSEHVLARNDAAASKLPETKPGLRKANGEYLPSEEILAHAKAHGVDQIGFVSHEELGRGAYFKRTTRRPGIAGKKRTGISFEKGTTPRSYEQLVASASDMASKYAAHHDTDRRLGRFGIGEYESPEHATLEADNFSHTPEGERITNALGPLVPVPIGPERVRLAGHVHPGSAEAARERFGVEQHKDVAETPQPAGKYTLLPQAVLDRLKEHEALSTQGALKKLGQKATNQWRQTALFTSPRWLLGNPQEHAIRLAVGGAAPKILGGRSGRFASRLVDAYDEIGKSDKPEAEAARQTVASLVRGTHYSAAEQMMIVRKADQFASSPLLGPALHQAERTTGALARTRDVVVAPWRAWRDTIGRGMTALERESRKASLGKVAIQDIHRFNGKWSNVLKMTDEAVAEYAKGTLTPAKTAQLVRETDDMMGAWGHLTPTVRGAVQTWAPFGLWWLTSLRWLRRMPLDHPTKTAVLAALNNATVGAHPTSTPSYLEGGIHVHLPLGLGGATLTPTYYSPAGVAIDPLQTAESLIAPQAIEPVANAAGVNLFTGKELSAPHGKGTTTGQRVGVILNDLATGLIPGARQEQQLREQSGKAYSTSNVVEPSVKPGTQRSLEQTIAKILSPVRFSYDPAGASSSGASVSARAILRQGLARERSDMRREVQREVAREARTR